ncbi:formimidoylglutamase [Edaphobacillus lindanitolerans]|uniref:Formimidoylglutamase n=1 Tax=Edaphobacillus lindanitolerans TaxID=550447 RepID=A0A1U7PKP3_9BACI|nr:formimidoylglutamase [Edaphobacillus lindanitolerans]SIT85628.1 formiminoglutamase [Edaphobacillus lindanitolerans]
MDFKSKWKGRIDSATDRAFFRYHQVVEEKQEEETAIALIGFCCDEGVRRNQGRPGAAEAPDALRRALAGLPWHGGDCKVADYGNVICEDGMLEEAQDALAEQAADAYAGGSKAVVLGGGHETLYGHYLGARLHLGPEAKLGIINIDAHFDLRPYDSETSSGTMFRQILDEDPKAGYFVLGIQRFGNTESLFDAASGFDVEYMPEEAVRMADPASIAARIHSFIDRHDAVIVTLCADVMNAASAPGVSAPSPFGLEPVTVRSIIRAACSHPDVLSFDISEVNPGLDENGRTIRLGAALTNEAILSMIGKAPEA